MKNFSMSTLTFFMKYFLRDGHSVLVHGYEGTDCTLLISTLAQLIMDPRSRTLEGFLALLEREWIQVRFSVVVSCSVLVPENGLRLNRICTGSCLSLGH